MNASHRPRAWLPLVVFVVCVGGTLALAQPPGFPRSPTFPTPPTIPPAPTFPTPPTFPPAPTFPENPGMADDGVPNAGTPPRGNATIPKPWSVPNAGMNEVEQKMWECEKCKHSWPAVGNTTPDKCPKCGTVFNEVKNADGTTTKTAAGRRNMYLGIGVVVIAIIAAIIKGVMSMSGSPPPKKKKKKVRRPRDDDDD